MSTVTKGWRARRAQAAASSSVVVISSMPGLHSGAEMAAPRLDRPGLIRPRTGGMKMNSQGEGNGPTGTSIRVGPSRRAKARRSAARSSSGVRARSAAAPKLSAKRTKSGLARSLAISRLPKRSCWMRRTLPKAPSLNTIAVSGMRWRTAVASSLAVNRKPPSPEIDTTGTSRRASCAPSAVAKPQPRLSW